MRLLSCANSCQSLHQSLRLTDSLSILLTHFFCQSVSIHSSVCLSNCSVIHLSFGLSVCPLLCLFLYRGTLVLSTKLIILNYPVILSHRFSSTVSWETCPLYLFAFLSVVYTFVSASLSLSIQESLSIFDQFVCQTCHSRDWSVQLIH